MSSKNAESWSYPPVGDVVEILDSRRIPLNAQERQKRQGQYAYYGANGQIDTIDDYLFDGNYVLIAEDGGYFDDPKRGIAYKVNGRFWVNNHAHIVKPRGNISTQFLVFSFNSINWMKYVSGTTRLKLTQRSLINIPFPLPPLNEQKRIVAKIEALQTRSQRVKEELEQIKPLLDQFRQSVLAAAFRGDLTEDWREQNLDIEPAEVLLERIRVERRRRWEEAELEKMKANGKVPKDDSWKKKYKEPEPIDVKPDYLLDLPDEWLWLSADECSYLITDGEHATPKRSDSGVYLLSARNILNGKISYEKVDFVPEDIRPVAK